MEDTARLAQIEMCVNNETAFETLLKELLQVINLILDNPHDGNFRKLKSDVLQPLLKYEELCAYLKYIGFESQFGEFVFPQEQKLSKLKLAQAAIEKKIIYCYGEDKFACLPKVVRPPKKICQLKPVNVLTTQNQFLQNIQKLFNDVLVYEDEELQELARSHIPLTQLQIRACERMREYQKKIKTGDIVGQDMTFEMALLAELVSWFKHKFFTWVDSPPCSSCGGKTRCVEKRTRHVDTETCLVEEYRCTSCPGGASFPRHQSPRVLLRTRRGRCGEYGNCFALLCRALGYDTRYVFDTTDHVWCEVYDFDSNTWIHVDPCEAVVDAPLLYSHGWGKRLAYVIAVSRDDLQDVTWRYTTQHKEVLTRRDLCTEAQLVDTILRLRAARQAQVAAGRRAHLAARALRELVRLQVDRKPEDYEAKGRISGSLEWREGRGETGRVGGHVFTFDRPGTCGVQYYASADEYRVRAEGEGVRKVGPWSAGVYNCRRVFRKVETDWKQVYLARDEGSDSGTVSWKVSGAGEHLAFRTLSIRAPSKVYETGKVQWTLTFDDQDPTAVMLGSESVQFVRTFKSVEITAHLSEGVGSVAWQHAQLFRQSLDCQEPTLEIEAQLIRDDNIDLD